MNNKIIIIDDDALFRSAQKRMLRRLKINPGEKITVLEASAGQEGMALLSEHAVDCILLDHDMPGGSGMSWLRRILDVFPEQAIVMLTGHGSEQLAVEAMKNGAMDYLVKGSITPEDMERAISNAIEKVELRKTIEAQRKELIQAEQQRVMIESLGTACHHIGQPATVISAYLEMMEDRESDEEMMSMITACKEASLSINEILQRLMMVSQYRTAPYLCSSSAESDEHDFILDL